MTRSELALQLRISLLELLAPDRRCARCQRFCALEDLEIDHAHGRDWDEFIRAELRRQADTIDAPRSLLRRRGVRRSGRP